MKPPFWDTAVATLAGGDAVLRGLIAAHPGVHLARRGDPFTTLARAIVGQQISVKAAQSIWDRLVAATGGGGTPVALDPARVRTHAHADAAPRRPVRTQGAVPARPRAPLRVGRARSAANGRRSPTRR